MDLDEPSSWSKAVPSALALARCFDAKVTLATVVAHDIAGRAARWSEFARSELVGNAEARLAQLADELRGGRNMATRVATGSIHGGILELAEEIRADLILLAADRPAMRDWLIGANASRVVRHARCSVLVVRE